MIIHVTQEYIDHGEKGHCRTCPVALALEEAGFNKPYVGITNFRVAGYKGDCIPRSYETSDEVYKFIDDFDKGIPVVPFSFEVDL